MIEDKEGISLRTRGRRHAQSPRGCSGSGFPHRHPIHAALRRTPRLTHLSHRKKPSSSRVGTVCWGFICGVQGEGKAVSGGRRHAPGRSGTFHPHLDELGGLVSPLQQVRLLEVDLQAQRPGRQHHGPTVRRRGEVVQVERHPRGAVCLPLALDLNEAGAESLIRVLPEGNPCYRTDR